ncbi:MAG: hypothetical protein AAF320_02910 [Myxococcota bacterium]
MKHDLILVALNHEQIVKAKEINGKRKRITHALICGPYGQLFGTENCCSGYYYAWGNNFSSLFTRRVKTNKHEITDFECTFNLVVKLAAAHDSLEQKRPWWTRVVGYDGPKNPH